jgi:hypothetical protein
MNGFLPPVIFEIQANAAGAIAQFRKVNTELSIMEAKALKAGKALTGFQKAAVIGTRALKVMGMAFAAFAAYGVREVILLEKSYNRLGQAMANAGVATKANLASTSELVDSYEKLGFGADKAADAYTVLITATQDVEKSNRLLVLSADLARTKTMSLEDAARALSRAQAGNARIFTQFGITLDNSKPKAEAVEEAMKKLEQRLGGQAQAYAKTFAGQMAILTENLGNLAEQIGMRVLPFLNKLVAGLNNTGAWIRKNSDFVIALGIAITVALIPAVVNLTKKLALLALTILKSPIGRLAVIIFAVSYAFVKAYNSSEDFRKKIASVAKFGLTALGYLLGVVETLGRGLSNATGMALKLRKAFQQLKNDDAGAAKTAKEIKNWEAEHAKIGTWTKKIEEAKKAIDSFAGKKITLNWDFKVPQIPGFDNGAGGGGGGVTEIADALINARQRVLDFNIAMKDTAKILKTTWSGVVGKDIKKAIEEGLLNPIDKLIVQAQKSVNAYQTASNEYTKSLSTLTNAQNAYVKAVEGGNEQLVASTTSALKRAEDAVNGLHDTMQKSMEDIEKLQDDMITAIVDSYNQIAELEQQRTDILESAKTERYELEKGYLKDTTQLRKQYDKDVLNAQREAAKRSAEIVKQSVDQLRGIYKTATYRSLGDIFSGLTFGGMYAKGGTTEKILAALGLQTSKAKRLADDAAQLAGLGFSQTFIEEVVSQGPDVGHSLAQTILKSSPESIVQMRTYWEELQKTSSHGVDLIANQLNKGVILATEELTAQLAQVGIDLNAQLAEYNQTLTEALAGAFDDYVSSLDKINIATTIAIAKIDTQIQVLQSRIAQLQYALQQLATLQAPGEVAVAPVLIKQKDPVVVDDSGISDDAKKELDEANKALADAIASSLADLFKTTDKDTKDAAYVAPTKVTSSLTSNSTSVTDSQNAARLAAQATPTVTIIANTNATSQSIADDVAWAIRTSGDVQYRTSAPNKTLMGFL